MVSVYESKHKAARKKFAYFLPDMLDQLVQDWKCAPVGELQIEEETYTIKTRYSRYEFVGDEEALPEENKYLPCLNIGIVPLAAPENDGSENKTVFLRAG